MNKTISLFVITIMAIVCFALSCFAGPPKYHPGGPYYYKSWANYYLPYRPVDEINKTEADELEKKGYSYYIAYFNNDGLIKTFEKRLKGKTEFKVTYIYEGGVLKSEEAIDQQGNGKTILYDGKGKRIEGSSDLSKPENAIALFVKAFRLGDDSLLSAVLAPHASIPEFNPIQKIECPSPQLIGFDIKESHVVVGKDQTIADSQPGDIEAHVALKIDKTLINKRCTISLWEKGVYVLRNSTSGWHIISVIPFWPKEIESEAK